MKTADKRTPSLIIVGVQKCGTTAIYKALCRHSQVEGAAFTQESSARFAPKELHYFGVARREQLGWDWYLRHFTESSKLKLEATPEYIANGTAIRHIRKRIPNAKILVLLRDPLDRATSAWNHWRSLGSAERWPIPRANGNFEDNILAELNRPRRLSVHNGFLTRGLYYKNIRLLRQHFPDEQIKVVPLESLIRSPESTMSDLQLWLGLGVESLPFTKANVRKIKMDVVPSLILQSLWRLYNYSNRILERSLGEPHPWARSWSQWIGERRQKVEVSESCHHPQFHKACTQRRHRMVLANSGIRRLGKSDASITKRIGLLDLETAEAVLPECSAEGLLQICRHAPAPDLKIAALREMFSQGYDAQGIDEATFLCRADAIKLKPSILKLLVACGKEAAAADLWREATNEAEGREIVFH